MVDAISMSPKIINILLAIAGLVSGKVVGNEMEAVVDNDSPVPLRRLPFNTTADSPQPASIIIRNIPQKLTIVSVEMERFWSAAIGSTICYGDLGCFGKNVPFYSLQRPINLPASPDIIDTMFRLFTRHNLGNTIFQMLRANDSTSLRNSNFDSGKPTKMVVHGFLGDGQSDWMMTMKEELLKAGDFNVILIDWGKGSGHPYTQATANTRVVGAEIAKLITALKEQVGARPEDFHIIGHSLGAHICGYAGERLFNLGRITGLDPAEPYFQYTEEIVRLDRTDAKFVDVIHTDGANIIHLGYGMIQPVGHVDYYPNGGITQPGCGVKRYWGCNHFRSYEYFTESISSACPFQAYRSSSYENFKRGIGFLRSNGNMGFHADRVQPNAGVANVKFFLDTGDSKPFCRYHYKIQLSFGNVTVSKKERGTVILNLMGTNGQLGEKALTDSNVDIEPGKTYGFVVTSTNDLGTINTATVSWQLSFSLFDFKNWNVNDKPVGSLYIKRLVIVNGETLGRAKFCGKNAKIEVNQSKLLTTKC